MTLPALAAVLSLTAYSVGVLVHRTRGSPADALTVFSAAWITCAATGLGVMPFAVARRFDRRWVAFGNAIAAGMMLAASMGLVEEGIQGGAGAGPADATAAAGESGSTDRGGAVPGGFNAEKVFLGFLLGGMFIWQSKARLDADPSESFHVMQLEGRDAKKVLLVMGVMTLHSVTEGIGIGVSFFNTSLGSFISATLAVHNIPEGVAIAVVMLPRGVSKLDTFLWCVASSVPQPVMAVPAFWFVEAFRPVVSVGLGFAAGAMLWVAVFELLPDASEEFDSPGLTIGIAAVSATALALVQVYLREDLNSSSSSSAVW